MCCDHENSRCSSEYLHSLIRLCHRYPAQINHEIRSQTTTTSCMGTQCFVPRTASCWLKIVRGFRLNRLVTPLFANRLLLNMRKIKNQETRQIVATLVFDDSSQEFNFHEGGVLHRSIPTSHSRGAWKTDSDIISTGSTLCTTIGSSRNYV